MSNEESNDQSLFSNIERHSPLKSGIKFDGLSIKPPHELDSYSQGSGMTARNLEMIMDEFGDTIKQDLLNNEGTTIILGNGTSQLPLEITNLQKDQNIAPNHKVIIDQVDLNLLLEDLNRIQASLGTNDSVESSEIVKQKVRVQKLVESSHNLSEHLEIRAGLIGKDSFAELENSGDVVISSYGPALGTLEEQLKLTKPGGVLYGTYKASEIERRADEIKGAIKLIGTIQSVGQNKVKITRKT